SVTLYGFAPDERPDIYGKIGNSGVSIATLDDMKVLYSGFDLCDPATSVSMTINGPAPTLLAMFFNTAIAQQVEKFSKTHSRQPDAKQLETIKKETLSAVRGTVQADILKEDQGQNTCIFSTEFSLKLMGNIQEYFIRNEVRNFYSVSISGYHIAEAGANPVSQLAFTLANGFTFVEAYLERGMHIDDFAPNLSFFFSYGMDPEYAVLGRVARRIWAVAMKGRYAGYQRGKIQEESLYYEHRKHDGSYPIIGVNSFRNPHGDSTPQKIELIRSTEEEKQSQLKRLRDFQKRNSASSPEMLERLRQAVIRNENVFAVLMDAVRVCSLGQITHALFEVGGQYRRNM